VFSFGQADCRKDSKNKVAVAKNFFSGGAGTVRRSVTTQMRDTPSNNAAQLPFDIEAVVDLRGLRLFLDRYEREILRPIELPAVLSAYWFANRGQFRELLELDAGLSASASLMPFAAASLSVGREQLRLLKPMYDQRMVQRFRKCVVAGEARGWNPVVFGIFLSIHSVPVREGLVQYGTRLWSGLVNGAKESGRLPDGECTELLGEYLDRLPGWIEEVVIQSMGEESARLAAVS
jgi:urease accessory protein UreF